MNGNELQATMLDALDELIERHQAAQWAYEAHREAKADYDEQYAAAMIHVTGLKVDNKLVYTNAEARAAAARDEMEHRDPTIASELADAAKAKAETAAACERAHEALKTYRAALAYETAQVELEAAKEQAKLPTYLRPGGLAPVMDDDANALPF